MTADDLLALDSDICCELLAGELVELRPAGMRHGLVVSQLVGAVCDYLANNPNYDFWIRPAGFLLAREPDTVLTPDIALTQRRAAVRDYGDELGFIELTPTIVIEVEVPPDSNEHFHRKLAIYFEAGVGEVWCVRPAERRVEVHRKDHEPKTIDKTGFLEGGDSVPGFRLPISDLFDE